MLYGVCSYRPILVLVFHRVTRINDSSGKYYYEYSPCKLINCDTTGGGTANANVCFQYTHTRAQLHTHTKLYTHYLNPLLSLSQACQFRTDIPRETFFFNIAEGPMTWTINNTNPLNFTIRYKPTFKGGAERYVDKVACNLIKGPQS